MSKFHYSIFYGGYDSLAVSKEKYTKEQAIKIAKMELASIKKPYYIAIGNGFARHRAGIDEDGEPCVGWWLEYQEHSRSCPCWVFHRATWPEYDSRGFKDYEYVHIPAVVETIKEEEDRPCREDLS